MHRVDTLRCDPIVSSSPAIFLLPRTRHGIAVKCLLNDWGAAGDIFDEVVNVNGPDGGD